MRKFIIILAALALLLGGTAGISIGEIQADELTVKQQDLVDQIASSNRSKAEIAAKLEELRIKAESQTDSLNMDKTLEQTALKALENIEVEEMKDKLELQSVTQQLLSTGSFGSLEYMGDNTWTWPVEGYMVVSQFYKRSHQAIDIPTKGEHPNVLAVQSGVVVRAGNMGDGYGNQVMIYHGNGVLTMYAHLKTIQAEVGMYVEEGTVVGLVGHTGWSSGDHLHFQVSASGEIEKATVNPMNYLEEWRSQLVIEK